MPKDLDFKSFKRRVRLVRFWRGATLGLVVGSLIACALVGIFRLRGHVAPWPYAVVSVCIVSVVWAFVSAFRRVSEFELADSLDRRAGLKNRLVTALTVSASEGLEAEQQADAKHRLSVLKPNRLYPIRFGRLQGLALSLLLAAGIVTVLGNRPIVLSALEREKQADSDEAATAVERVLEPYNQQLPRPNVSQQEKTEVAEMEKLARDLHNGKLDREQALQAANKAVEDAKKLESKTAEGIKAKLEKAETAMQALDASAKPDAAPIDPAAEMEEASEAREQELQKQIDATKKALEGAKGQKADDLKSQLSGLQKRMDSAKKANSDAQAAFKAAAAQHQDDERHLEDLLEKDSPPNAGGGSDPLAEFKRLHSNLSAAIQAEIANIKKRLLTATGAEAERLKKKLAELEAQFNEAKKEVEAFNKALRAAIKANKLKKQQAQNPGPSQPTLHTKFNKPMRQALAKLKQALNKIESGDDLSQEESESLTKLGDNMDVEAANAAASGDKERSMTAKLLAQIARELATGNAAVMLACNCQGALSGSFSQDTHGNSHQASRGSYMPTSSENNTGKVNHLDKPAPGQGKTNPTMIDPLQGDGPSSYIEVRGPASIGARSAIPYRSVLPSYRRKEEAALTKGKIPKKHLKRVRAYFDSLTGR